MYHFTTQASLESLIKRVDLKLFIRVQACVRMCVLKINGTFERQTFAGSRLLKQFRLLYNFLAIYFNAIPWIQISCRVLPKAANQLNIFEYNSELIHTHTFHTYVLFRNCQKCLNINMQFKTLFAKARKQIIAIKILFVFRTKK